MYECDVVAETPRNNSALKTLNGVPITVIDALDTEQKPHMWLGKFRPPGGGQMGREEFLRSLPEILDEYFCVFQVL